MNNRLFSIVIICAFAFACDRVETKYKDYKTANEKGYFQKGWIPKSIVYKSMTNIYVQNDLDINTTFFVFNLSESDFTNLETKIYPTKKKYKNPHRIKVQHDWIKKINKSQIYFVLSEKDTVYLAFDKKNNQVFGWNY